MLGDTKKKAIIELTLEDRASAELRKVQSTTQTTATGGDIFAKVAAAATAAIVVARRCITNFSWNKYISRQRLLHRIQGITRKCRRSS